MCCLWSIDIYWYSCRTRQYVVLRGGRRIRLCSCPIGRANFSHTASHTFFPCTIRSIGTYSQLKLSTKIVVEVHAALGAPPLHAFALAPPTSPRAVLFAGISWRFLDGQFTSSFVGFHMLTRKVVWFNRIWIPITPFFDLVIIKTGTGHMTPRRIAVRPGARSR